MVLDNDDIIDSSEADAEILGAGTVMAFAVITPLMLLAYAVEGRKVVKVKSFCHCMKSISSKVVKNYIILVNFTGFRFEFCSSRTLDSIRRYRDLQKSLILNYFPLNDPRLELFCMEQCKF